MQYAPTVYDYLYMHDPLRFRRRSTRIKGFDYAHANMFFVTMCVKNREHLLGEIHDEKMHFSEIGKILEEELVRTPLVRSNVEIDEYIVMPNHGHAIFILNRRGSLYTPPDPSVRLRSPSQTLGAIIRGLKGAVTKRVQGLYGGYEGDLWQRNFHEVVIRTEEERNHYRQYIKNNVKNWLQDKENLKY
jgi:putative transposase